MQPALVFEWYLEIPKKVDPEPELAWRLQHQRAVDRFRRQVSRRYSVGTLERLIESPDPDRRQASVFALGLMGNQASNAVIARLLSDASVEVRATAEDSLWSLWFRGSTESNNQELRRVVRMRDRLKALSALDILVRKAPRFSEALNQRGLLYFRLERYMEALADYTKVLELNPFHFAAQAGLGQCYLQLGRDKAALRAFRDARRINPNIQGIDETIGHLERIVGGEGSPDDSMHGV